MLIGSGWVCLSCLFHLELSMALPSGFTSCFLSCPTWPERTSFTLPLKGVLCSTWLPSAAGEVEKLSTMHQFLVRSSCSGGFTKGQVLGKCLDGDSEPFLCQPLSSAAGPHSKA